MACLRHHKNNTFGPDWIKEMHQVSNVLADSDICTVMNAWVPITTQDLFDHGFEVCADDPVTNILPTNPESRF